MGESRQNITGEITTLNIITGTHTYEKKRNKDAARGGAAAPPNTCRPARPALQGA
jgi:hypothetical protein